MNKKSTIAFILSCFILLPLFFSTGLQVFQLYLKHRVEKRLEKESLVTISCPVQKIKWIEDGREIMVEGQMFDVKTYRIENGIFIGSGVYDEDETKAMELFKNFNEKEQNYLLIHLLLYSQLFVAVAFGIFLIVYNQSCRYRLYGIQPLPYPYAHPLVPPPRPLI